MGKREEKKTPSVTERAGKSKRQKKRSSSIQEARSLDRGVLLPRRLGNKTEMKPVPEKITVSTATSPRTGASFVADEYVEVTVVNIDDGFATSRNETTASAARSPMIRRSSSNRLRQFSQELKAEVVAKARQFSQELKAELRRFSWSHNRSETALVARDRNRSGTRKALRGLKFISSKSNGVDSWNKVQSNFDRLAKDAALVL